MFETTFHIDFTQYSTFVYYIHPSDHDNLKLVSIVFDGIGFGDWKQFMMIGLIAKNKLYFVDETLPKLLKDDVNKKTR